MVYFKNQRSHFGKIFEGLGMETVGIHILWPFGITVIYNILMSFSGNLEYFPPYWYIVSRKIWQHGQVHMYKVPKRGKMFQNYSEIKQMPTKYMYQMSIKCTNIFYGKTLQNFPKIGIFGSKLYHLATLLTTTKKNRFLSAEPPTGKRRHYPHSFCPHQQKKL
jgi:hypothetical protein